MRLRHSITITDYDVQVFASQGISAEGGKWIARRKLAEVPLTGLTRKILAGLEADSGQLIAAADS